MLFVLKAVNSDLFLPRKCQNRGTKLAQLHFFGNFSGSGFVCNNFKFTIFNFH